MRTVRSSGRISGGGVPGPGQGGVPGPVGVHLVWGVYLVLGGTWSRGVHLVPGGVPGPGGCTWSQGVYLVPGDGVPGPGGCTWSGTPPCGQTHACKNITFATSLWTVTRLHSSRMRTWTETPPPLGQRLPPSWTETSPLLDRDFPPLGQRLLDRDPPQVETPLNRITDRCKNITLPHGR